MSKKDQSGRSKPKKQFIFGKRNYLIMFAGLGLIALGYILMAGGGSEDPNVFDESIFNFRRIRLAPTLVLLGLGLQVFAILANPDKNKKR
jgi:hypothetical protein